ncbi:MAG: peptide chain release factor H [Cellvibrionaceae bacterium]|nr:peptide chain release factor H [Cellvibrionaceae bacterium]|tara:strand:+ start:32562 stop:33281 length:720 start_codon:yes stop_codon:yes gene_type:complete
MENVDYQKRNKKVVNKQPKVVWLQLSAGQGPKECGWVVAQLMKRLLQDAQKHSISAELVDSLAFDKAMRKQNLIEVDAYLSSLIRLEAIDVEAYVRSWLGPIKWQGESPYRPKHKRYNWFAGIELVSVNGDVGIDVKQLAREVDVEAMRSGGPGGQHVNKTSSAVRITHRPTGRQIRVESDRSQHRNRQLAMERLQIVLAEGVEAEGRAQVRDRWLQHYQVKRGNPVRVFQGSDFIEKR